MPHNKVRGILLDADYSTDETGYSSVRLYVRTGKGIQALADSEFRPYFYAVAEDAKKAQKGIGAAGALGGAQALSVEEVKKENAQNVLKLSFRNTEELTKARDAVKSVPGVIETREFDIPFANRYLMDKGLEPMGIIEAEVDAGSELSKRGQEGKGEENAPETQHKTAVLGAHLGMAQVARAAGLRSKTNELQIKSIKALPEDAPEIGKLKIGCFDLETYSPGRFSDPTLDPILMASYADENGAVVFTNHKGLSGAKNVVACKGEKEIVEGLAKRIRDAGLDIIVTYNGDRFDFPYIIERAKKLNAEFGIGLNRAKPRLQRRGMENAAKVQGLVHVDAYQMMQLLARFGVVNLVKFDLESVQEALFGEKKEKIHAEDINKIWDSGSRAELERLAKYNAEDSVAARRLVVAYLPLVAELGRLAKHTLYDTSRGSASMLVEGLLMSRAFGENLLVPNRPKEDEIKQRMMQSYEGGYVKAPVPGLHENIAVLDFRSLHPSIIISHNISPETLNCGHAECKTGANLAPTKDWFCGKRKGFLAEELRGILELRIRLKKEMKSIGKGSAAHAALDSRQHALKILLNSHYGYLAYARSRWYSRECARAITAWSRHYVREVMDNAEKTGFSVLYGDSITADRFVTVRENGRICIRNAAKLFEKCKGLPAEAHGKEFKRPSKLEALCVNPVTLHPEWKPVKKIIRHKSSKRIYRVNQKYGETRVSEDHSLMVLGKEGFVEATPTNLGNRPLYKVSTMPRTAEIGQIDLFEELKNYNYDMMYKGRIKIAQAHKNDSHVWFGWMSRKEPVRAKRFIRVGSKEFDALCRLLGAYVAEGSASTIETTKRKGASIASSNKEWLAGLEADYHAIFENVKTCIIQSTKKPRVLEYSLGNRQRHIEYRDSTCKLQMMNEASAVLFKALGGQKSEGKRIPDFIFNVPEKYKRVFLDKLLEGDGSRSFSKKYSDEYVRNNFAYTTKSLELASGVSLLLAQLGITHTINYRQSKKAYTLKTSSKHNKRLATKVTEEPYRGYVYDLEVEGNSNFVDACGQVLLHNTDSEFLVIPEGKTAEFVREFVAKVNEGLRGNMELELEGIYRRGLFVTKKEGGAAKKRYALIDDAGKLKIVGFEYVRRDWARIAKNTQRSVIEAVLKEGKPGKAVEIVKKAVDDLRKGNVKKSELVILTEIKKPLKDYEAIGPHVAAAQKAIKRGKQMGMGSVVGYIITKTGKSISERAEMEEYVKEGNYDADYYIENQVIPAVIKILAELGYSRDDLVHNTRQQTLAGFG